MKNKRVVFLGTPKFSVPILQTLIDNTNIVLVVTQSDKFVGRNKELKYSPIKELALKHNIEVFQPLKIREDFEYILSFNPDIIVTAAYGQIIPKELLYTPKYKAINVHASLLPYLRGGAPIHHAIIDGYEETGITIMYMAEGMDTGNIISQEKIKIIDSDTYGSLHDKLSFLGADLLLKTLPDIFNETNKSIKQDESKVTYGYNIKREDELLDFKLTSREVFNKIRGLNPEPMSYFILNDEVIKAVSSEIGKSTEGEIGQIVTADKNGLGIKCKDYEIIITRLKPEGKKEMNAIDYINGKRKENIIGKCVNEKHI